MFLSKFFISVTIWLLISTIPSFDGLYSWNHGVGNKGFTSRNQLLQEFLEILLGEGSLHHTRDVLLITDGENGGITRSSNGELLFQGDAVTSLRPEESEGFALVGGSDSGQGFDVLVSLRGGGIINMG